MSNNDFFVKYSELCHEIQKAVRSAGFRLVYLFDPEMGAEEGFSEDLREVFKRGKITSVKVEEFLKEGCKRFFSTKLSLLEAYKIKEGISLSKGYRFKIDPLYVRGGYDIVEGSPFAPPDSFYEVDFKKFALENKNFRRGRDKDLYWLGGKYYNTDTGEDVFSLFKDICDSLFGRGFFGASTRIYIIGKKAFNFYSPEVNKDEFISLMPGLLQAERTNEYLGGVLVLRGNDLAPSLATKNDSYFGPESKDLNSSTYIFLSIAGKNLVFNDDPSLYLYKKIYGGIKYLGVSDFKNRTLISKSSDGYPMSQVVKWDYLMKEERVSIYYTAKKNTEDIQLEFLIRVKPRANYEHIQF